MQEWSGVFVVAVTPFTERGALDETACRQLLDLLVSEGVQGIIVAGSTGEWITLTHDERQRLFEIAKEQVGGQATLIAGTSAVDTREAVRLTKAARTVGMDGCLVLPPPYVMPTERETLAHFALIAEVGLPMMIYNNPGRTHVNLTARLVERLAALESVVALKDSEKDLLQLSETLRLLGERLAIFCGLEPYALPCIQRGAAGMVSMTGNIIGRQVRDFYAHAVAGRWKEAVAVEHLIDCLFAAFYAPGRNPYAVIKECMRLVGRPGGWPRPPLLPLEPADREALARSLAELGLPTRVYSDSDVGT